jgi:hypothetical protein
VVSELAYRNDYIMVRAQTKLADEAWQRNKCQVSAPADASAPAVPGAPPATAKRAKSSTRTGSAVH